MKEWGNRHPIVILPTKYYSTPINRFRELGINLVIWANHNLRGAIKYMQEITAKIYKEQSLTHVEDRVVLLVKYSGYKEQMN